MNFPSELRTERLLLRPWKRSDRAAFAALCGDARVMQYFPAPLTPAKSDAVADKIAGHFQQYGYGFWGVEIPGKIAFAGFVGLSHPRFEASFTPCVEIGWCLAADFWNCGYATEAAQRALAFGFETVGLSEILSFTAAENIRSQRVMQKLGMTRNPRDDFDHPALPRDHRLCRHVLYRIAREDAGVAEA